jgi:DHA1 family vesicular acetylcholine transporter-like MFS transporter 3
MDPFVAVCSGALIMANVSLAFIEPTITTWMSERMPDTPPWQVLRNNNNIKLTNK